MPYDQKCHDLAEHFLRDHPRCKTLHPEQYRGYVRDLAEELQAVAENFEIPEDGLQRIAAE